jgi:hypothetical protein
MNLLLIIIGSLFLLVLVSFGVEALRRRPNAPHDAALGSKDPDP